MDFTDLMVDACIEKDALRGRRFTRINVRRNTDVPISINWCFACHVKLSNQDANKQALEKTLFKKSQCNRIGLTQTDLGRKAGKPLQANTCNGLIEFP
jgi:hypothetical protein